MGNWNLHDLFIVVCIVTVPIIYSSKLRSRAPIILDGAHARKFVPFLACVAVIGVAYVIRASIKRLQVDIGIALVVPLYQAIIWYIAYHFFVKVMKRPPIDTSLLFRSVPWVDSMWGIAVLLFTLFSGFALIVPFT